MEVGLGDIIDEVKEVGGCGVGGGGGEGCAADFKI